MVIKQEEEAMQNRKIKENSREDVALCSALQVRHQLEQQTAQHGVVEVSLPLCV